MTNASTIPEILAKMPLLTKLGPKIGQYKTDMEIAIEIYEFLDEYRLRQLPKAPAKVQDYYDSDIKVIQRMNKEPENFRNFWNDPIVANYFFIQSGGDASIEHIINLNERNLKVLKWLRHQFQEVEEKIEIISGYIYPFQEATYPKFENGKFKMLNYKDFNWPLFNI